MLWVGAPWGWDRVPVRGVLSRFQILAHTSLLREVAQTCLPGCEPLTETLEAMRASLLSSEMYIFWSFFLVSSE